MNYDVDKRDGFDWVFVKKYPDKVLEIVGEKPVVRQAQAQEVPSVLPASASAKQ